MDLAHDTVARLNELAELGNGYLVLLFRDLVRSAAASTSTCLAVILAPDQEAPLYAMDEQLRAGTATVHSSLRIEITVADPAPHQYRVIFLAAEPGEYSPFVTLPLSTFSSSGARLERLVVDADLDAAASIVEPPLGSKQARTVDRALGFLLDRGMAPDEGRKELLRRAELAGNDIHTQACLVLGLDVTPD